MQKNSLNKVILIGNLGQDPEARFTPQGTAVTNLSIATNESWKDQSGEMQDRTEWHRVVMYGRMAETATEYMKKGRWFMWKVDFILGNGKIRIKSKRKTTEIRCDNFTMLGRRSDAPAGQSQGAMSPSPSAPGSEVDDDLPF